MIVLINYAVGLLALAYYDPWMAFTLTTLAVSSALIAAAGVVVGRRGDGDDAEADAADGAPGS